MGKETKIEWCDATWNPWVGCTPVSPGCKNCYAMRGIRRWGRDPHKIVRTKDKSFNAPLKYRAPKRIFVCSWSDFFHPDAPHQWRLDAWAIMRVAKHHTFLILTKRPVQMFDFPDKWPDNVWPGVTVENQDQLWRIEQLLYIPATTRFVSVEPMLGSIEFRPCRKCNHSGNILEWPCSYCKGRRFEIPDWVICGGESGPGTEPTHLDWLRDLRNQCKAAKVPFFFKQWGGMKIPGETTLLDGKEWHQWPKTKTP